MEPGQSTPGPLRAGGSASDNDDEFEYSYVEDKSQPLYSKSMMEMSAMWPVRPRLYKMMRIKTPKKRTDSMMPPPPPSASTVDGQGRSSQAPTLVGEQDTDFEKNGDATPHRKKKKRKKDKDREEPSTPREETNELGAGEQEEPVASGSKKKKKRRKHDEQQSSQIDQDVELPADGSQKKKKKKSKHHSSSQPEPELDDAPIDTPKRKKKKRSRYGESSQAEPEPQDLPEFSPTKSELPATPSPEPRPIQPIESVEPTEAIESVDMPLKDIPTHEPSSQADLVGPTEPIVASPKKRKRSRKSKEDIQIELPGTPEREVTSKNVFTSELPVRKRKQLFDEVGDAKEAKKQRLGTPDELDVPDVQAIGGDVHAISDVQSEALAQISPDDQVADNTDDAANVAVNGEDDDEMDEQELLNAQIFSSQQALEPELHDMDMGEDEPPLNDPGDSMPAENNDVDRDADMSDAAPHFDDPEDRAPSDSEIAVEEDIDLPLDEEIADEGSHKNKNAKATQSKQRAPKKPWSQAAADLAEENHGKKSPPVHNPSRKSALKTSPTTSSTATKKKKKQKLRERMRGGTNERELGPEEKPARRRRKTKEKKSITTEGSRSTQEERALKEVFKDFVATYGLTQSAANDLIHENPTQDTGRDAKKMKKDFWQRAEDVCPGRDRKSLMSCCRRLFHNSARGEWSEEEKNQLHHLFEKHGRKFRHIGNLVNRDRMDVRHYYLTVYRCMGKQKKGKWTPEEEEQYLSIVNSILEKNRKKREEDPQNTPSRKKAGVDDENLINWEDVSARMGYTRNDKQCRTKWNTLREKGVVTLGDETPRPPSHKAQLDLDRKTLRLMKQDDIITFVRAVEASGAKESKNIPWNRLADPKFRRKWKRPTLQLLWSRLSKTMPEHESHNVSEIAKYLIQQYESGERLNILQDDEVDGSEEARIIGGLWNTPAATPKRQKARVVSSAVAVDSTDSEQEPDEEEVEKAPKAEDDLGDADAEHEMDDIQSEREGSTGSVDLSLVTASEEPLPTIEKGTETSNSGTSRSSVEPVD